MTETVRTIDYGDMAVAIRRFHPEDQHNIDHCYPCVEICKDAVFLWCKDFGVKPDQKKAKEPRQNAAESVEDRFTCKSLDLTHLIFDRQLVRFVIHL